VRVAGVDERASPYEPARILGALQYAAPEYFVGDAGTERSDFYSLGVITYQMLSGRLPYGAEAARVRTRKAQLALEYEALVEADIPAWLDAALRKAVHPDPLQRYESLSEFVYDLRHPNASLLRATPLVERNPALFWKAVSLVLGIALLLALLARFGA